MSYLKEHKASGLKVGDVVRIVRKAKSYEGNWKNTWPDAMDRYVGRTFEIYADHGLSGFYSSEWSYSFPYFVLEKVQDEELFSVSVNTSKGITNYLITEEEAIDLKEFLEELKKCRE